MVQVKLAPKTGDVLIANGSITRAQFEIAFAQQKAFRAAGKQVPIGELLVRAQFATTAQVAAAIDSVTSGGVASDHSVLLPPEFCVKHNLVPSRTENGILFVKTPRRLRDIELLWIRKNCAVSNIRGVREIAATKEQISAELSKLVSVKMSFKTVAHAYKNDASGSLINDALKALLSEALSSRASDIHIDRKKFPDSWISFRVDGSLKQEHLISESLMGAIVTKIKSEAGMDASNSVYAQDGRLSLQVGVKTVEFRVNSQPTIDGETLALRVLDSNALPTLSEMFPGQNDVISLFETLSKVRGKSGGLFLATGPTGSGKTSTLYALARLLQRDSINVLTVEDPVEYRLPFARQIQLNSLLDQKAGDIERSMLRQDPDVIILGEIRTRDTAKAALKFAESGHFVLATLHADSVKDVFERIAGFFEDGAQKNEAKYVLSRQIRTVINQQLVGKLCDCSVIDSVTPQTSFTRLGLSQSVNTRIRIGCERCAGTGIFGRVMAHEILSFQRERSATSNNALLDAIKADANVCTVPGAVYHSRENVLSKLVDQGLVDFSEASSLLSR
jgi:type II secretory ATPase GspE/PulE/Tfp pilus assembly ATPase PilB-like protein